MAFLFCNFLVESLFFPLQYSIVKYCSMDYDNINVDLKEPMQMIETAFIEFGSYNLDRAINMN